MLHTVNKSPFERNALESCLRLAASGASVLLIEDGVIAALAGTAAGETIAGRRGDLKFYVLGPDIAARGLPARRRHAFFGLSPDDEPSAGGATER